MKNIYQKLLRFFIEQKIIVNLCYLSFLLIFRRHSIGFIYFLTYIFKCFIFLTKFGYPTSNSHKNLPLDPIWKWSFDKKLIKYDRWDTV